MNTWALQKPPGRESTPSGRAGAVRGPYRPLGGSSSEERSGRIRFSGKRNEPQKKVWAGLGRLSLTSGSYDNLDSTKDNEEVGNLRSLKEEMG